MDTQLVRTTLEFDPSLVYEAKMLALQEGTTFRNIVERGLRRELFGNKKLESQPVKIGGYHLGGVKGELTRTDIYEDF